jgi:hypothetical protein
MRIERVYLSDRLARPVLLCFDHIMSDHSSFHLKTASGGRLPLRWLPCEERCRDHLDGSRWTQALLDEIPLQELGYFLSMTPTTIMYNHLRRRIERGALTARFQSLAQGMLRTIEDILGSRPPAEDPLVSNKRPCAPQAVGVRPGVPVDMGWYPADPRE